MTLRKLTQMQWRRLTPLMVFAFIAIVLSSGLMTPDKIEMQSKSPLINTRMPAFTLPLLSDPTNMFLPVMWRGKPIVLNVFASWCEPCKAEQPLLLQMQQQGIGIYGIAWKDKVEKVNDYLATSGNPFTAVGVDGEGRTTLALGLRGVPETFVIDPSGVVRWHISGPLTQEMVNQQIIPLLLRYEKN